MVFLSSTLYAFCIETKINFVNQNKGQITLILFPWGRVSLAMSWRSGSFQLKMVANKKLKIPWEKKSIHFVMVNAIQWEFLMPLTKCEGLSYPTHFLKGWVVLLGITFLNTEQHKQHFLCDEMIFMHCSLQIKQKTYSIGNLRAPAVT